MCAIISVIIPVYNSEKYLPKCVDSVLAQSFKNFEVILIDDGSTDYSGIICEEYSKRDNRVKAYCKPNGGVSSARNFGLCQASGEYITFVDADDWVESNLLECYYNTIRQSNADLIRCGYVREHNDSKKNVSINNVITFYDLAEVEELVESQKLYGYLWNSIYKRDLIKCLTFDESLSWCEDHIFSYEYLLKCKSVTIIPDCLYHYCVRENDSLSTKIEPISWTEATIRLTRLRIELSKRDKYKIQDLWNGCANFISSMIFVLYKKCTYQERKRYREQYMCLNLSYPSFFGKLFFSKIPFFLVDVIINIRLKFF